MITVDVVIIDEILESMQIVTVEMTKQKWGSVIRVFYWKLYHLQQTKSTCY